MDRKKTIMITVMINAGLLVVLFVAAMTTRENGAPQGDLSRAPRQAMLEAKEKPLYGETMEIAPSIESLETTAASLAEPAPTFVLPAIAAESQIPASPGFSGVQSSLPAASLEFVKQKGDSLEKLAKKHRVSVDNILKTNGLSSSFLKEGQRLKIPEAKIDTKSKTKPALSEQQAEYYTMKVGDNPWSVAMKYHIKVDELLRLNGLNEKTARKLKP